MIRPSGDWFRAHPVRRQGLTLSLAGVGVALFWSLGLPLPFLFGPLAACLIGALAGAPLKGTKVLSTGTPSAAAPQRRVERVFRHRARPHAQRRKQIIALVVHCPQVFQQFDRLIRQWHIMIAAHFHLGSGNQLNPLDQIKLFPFGVPDFAGPLCKNCQ